MAFEYDPNKAEVNLKNHGVSFSDSIRSSCIGQILTRKVKSGS
jgi:uncharacterized DUF497 family protein